MIKCLRIIKEINRWFALFSFKKNGVNSARNICKPYNLQLYADDSFNINTQKRQKIQIQN